jgi:Arc/MetJ-type ribon-helix-helix transcriptional regulator
LLLEYIEGLVERGYFRSREHAIQAAIDSFFTEERINQSLRAAEGMEVAAGKKVKVDIDEKSPKILSR